MIMRKSNKKDGEPLTLDGLMTELNNLFASRKDDPAAKDIKSMIKSLVNGEACFEEKDEEESTQEGIDISNEDLSGGMVGYDHLYEAVNAKEDTVKDKLGDDIPVVAFISSENMMEGVVDTIRAMKFPTIVAAETTDGGERIVTKAFVACGETRTKLLENGSTLPALVFDEKNGGMCRMSINRKDGYDFIIGENKTTRFIIFDESVCPASIPTDIITDDRKWGKRMTSEIPKLIEKTIEESNSDGKKSAMCNLPKTCEFNTIDERLGLVKKPIISDIMKDFAEAKTNGKVGKDTFVEFMKPENKEAVANAVIASIAENQNPSNEADEPTSDEKFANDVMNAFNTKEEDDFSEDDTNPDCFRRVAEYMVKEGVDSVHFWTDGQGLIHCDEQIKNIYKVELEDSDK